MHSSAKSLLRMKPKLLAHKAQFLLTLPALDFSSGSVIKNLPANAGDLGSITGLGRSLGEGNGYPLQYSCLENSMDRSLMGYSPWGCKESHRTQLLTLSLSLCLQPTLLAAMLNFCVLRAQESLSALWTFALGTSSSWSLFFIVLMPAHPPGSASSHVFWKPSLTFQV